MPSRIFDITHTLNSKIAMWPGSDQPQLKRVMSIKDGEDCNLTELAFSAHTGTHLDAPLHIIDDGIPVEELDLNTLIGPAQVIEFPDNIDMISLSDIESVGVHEDTIRLIIKTRNSAKWEADPTTFNEDYVAIAPEAAKWIVNRGIKLVGIDHLSVAPFREDYLVETHVILLGAGIIAVEGLRLAEIEPGNYQLICLPPKLEGSDGAPCRAVLIPGE